MGPCLDPALHRHLNRKVGYNFRVILAFKVPYWQAQFSFCGEYQPRENALLNKNLSGLKLVSSEINGNFFHFKQTNKDKQTNSKTKKTPVFSVSITFLTPLLPLPIVFQTLTFFLCRKVCGGKNIH